MTIIIFGLEKLEIKWAVSFSVVLFKWHKKSAKEVSLLANLLMILTFPGPDISWLQYAKSHVPSNSLFEML